MLAMARGVSTFSCVTSVPSTSASRSLMEDISAKDRGQKPLKLKLQSGKWKVDESVLPRIGSHSAGYETRIRPPLLEFVRLRIVEADQTESYSSATRLQP